MARLSPLRIAEKQAEADRLQPATDEAARHVRNLYIVFLSFGLYLAITVGGTTDEQLLRGSPVRLPIVDVALPLFAFYWLAPALFVLFHFNLLLQLNLLSQKLSRLNAALDGLHDEADRRISLSQFVFSQMLIGSHGPGKGRATIKVLLNLMAWITFVLLPLAVLLLAQIQFLPYHDSATTWWQRVLIGLDLLLLWLLWLPAIERVGDIRPRFRLVPRGTLAGLSAVSLLVSLLVATIPGGLVAWPLMDRVIGKHSIMLFNRNLSLPEAKLLLRIPDPIVIEKAGEARALDKYTDGLDLTGRNLRFADLTQTDMRKADLRRADLQGANLVAADLQGADLSRAHLWRARVGDEPDARWRLADLRGADAEPVDLAALIAEMQEQIPNEDVRGRVVARLESSLGERPIWQGQPQVMFPREDPIAKGLGWSGLAMTEPIYDLVLASFIGNLVCDQDGSSASPSASHGV